MNRLALSATLAAVIAATPVTAATAGAHHGSVSITLTPRGDNAKIVREGYLIYSLFKGAKNRAKVDQRGIGNGSAIAQHGTNDAAEVFQRGRGHSTSIMQTGSNNVFGVLQFGRKTSSSIAQTGNGQAGLVIQGGW